MAKSYLSTLAYKLGNLRLCVNCHGLTVKYKIPFFAKIRQIIYFCMSQAKASVNCTCYTRLLPNNVLNAVIDCIESYHNVLAVTFLQTTFKTNGVYLPALSFDRASMLLQCYRINVISILKQPVKVKHVFLLRQ